MSSNVEYENIRQVMLRLWAILGDKGVKRNFTIRRNQLKRALGVTHLRESVITKLQDCALEEKDMIVVDLDEVFVCMDLGPVRNYRAMTKKVFEKTFSEGLEDDDFGEEEEGDDLDDEDFEFGEGPDTDKPEIGDKPEIN